MGGWIDPSGRDLAPYDFTSPPGSSDRPPTGEGSSAATDRAAIDLLLADFAAALETELSRHLRCDVGVSLVRGDESPYGDFLASLASPTSLSLLRIDPPGAQACLELSPSAAFAMIERMLGGGGGATSLPVPPRALSGIEQGMALQIVERVAKALAGAGEKVVPGLAVREEEWESDPARARIMPDGEIVTTVRLQVQLGRAGDGGSITLALPAPVTQLLAGHADAAAPPPAPMEPSPADRERDAHHLHRNVLGAAVELRALLAETKVRLSDVLEMEVGDLLTTQTSPDAEVPVHLEGRPLFRGLAGHFQGSRVVQITAEAAGDGPAGSAADGAGRLMDAAGRSADARDRSAGGVVLP